MAETVQFDKSGRIGVVRLDNPPVNALGAALRRDLVAALARAAHDPEVEAIVLTGRGRCFSAGADIREFGAPPRDPSLREVITAVEDCPKPVIAAIHNTAVGGGLELALGCHYRIGVASARLGLPEIKLGLIPGAGGTQRLPRLVGIGPALKVILSGDFLSADPAEALGLLDVVFAGDLVAGAVAFAERVLATDAPLRKARELEIPGEAASAEIFEDARKNVGRRARGLIAPGRCIDSIENASRLSFAEGMARERAYFVECLESPQSKAQRHIFFAERQAAKIPDLPKETPIQEITEAAVIGCGTMGAGIAMTFANAGIPVTVLETSQEDLDRGLEKLRKTYAGSLARGRFGQDQVDRRLALIQGVTDYAALDNADIVIEAVFEDMGLKKEVFGKLDAACKSGAILATNTSTLDVDEIAAATGRPEKVIGTHFFSPANVMRLMENVRGAKTSPETIATVMKLSKTIGKVGVLVGICDGFVGNRMYHAYTRQAQFLLEEGALPEQVDRVIHDFGFAMGPFAVGDVAGLDVSWRIRQRRAATRPPDERYSPIADRICALNRFGQKTGAGWYKYEKDSRKPIPDPEIEKIIIGVSKELGIARRNITDDEILERCLYPLINEGAKILGEGLALRSSDIDLIWIYGYGFPKFRGGPMFSADQIGVKTVYDVMNRLHGEHGEMLRPAPLLEELAKTGKDFGET